jgi:7-alpha-hydroxysteroid dehydrogenase
MTLSIAGKTAIVTGAANGVGLAIGRHFVAQGANVMFADRDEARLEAELGEASRDDEPGATRYFAGDLRERLTVANLLSATIDAYDRVDVLVNASRQIMTTDPLDPDDESVMTLLQQNLLTTLRVSQTVAKRMIHQADDDGSVEGGRAVGNVGTIINIGSIAGRRTQPELLAYSISAAALDQATRSLAVSLARERIRVNGVSVGSVMSTNLKTRLKEHPSLRQSIVDATPMGRIAAPSELAETVQYLASDASGFMIGQILTVDGGRTLIDPVVDPTH